MLNKTQILSMSLLVSSAILEMLKWDIISATLKINKENGSNLMTAALILLTQQTFKPNASVDPILTRMNMIGIRDKIVKVLIFSAIEEKIEVISKYK